MPDKILVHEFVDGVVLVGVLPNDAIMVRVDQIPALIKDLQKYAPKEGSHVVSKG